MSASMFDVALPLFRQALSGLQNVLDKGEAHARDAGRSPDSLLQARLCEDMQPLGFQVALALNHSADALRRMQGEQPEWRTAYETFDVARSEAADGLAFVRSIAPADLTGAEGREVVFKAPGVEQKFEALSFLTAVSLPNCYFHVVTAYAILRHLGVTIGKFDYLAMPPPRSWTGVGGTATRPGEP